jgi:oligopeptide/dipeptide ABC transporter ATP-binding protein
MSEQQPLLRVNGLVAHFRGHRTGVLGGTHATVHAVDGVSFEMAAGETLGIVGESGCGKSTLARTLVRLVEPTAGEAWFDGRDLFRLSRKELRDTRRDIQMIFQDPYSSVNPRMTVEAIVAEAWDGVPEAAPPGKRRARVTELLERVGLDADALDRYPREFSGGQLQRIGIARALAVNPRLLICDEPVSALDVSIQAQVLNLLKKIQRESNLACIFISHDLAVVQHVTDRIAVMYFGKIVELGPAETVCETPSHPYTQALLSAVPDAKRTPGPGRRIRLVGDLPDPTHPPTGCRFRTRCWKARERCGEEPALEPHRVDGVVAACHFPVSDEDATSSDTDHPSVNGARGELLERRTP